MLRTSDPENNLRLYQEPWIQDNLQFTTALCLVSAALICICGSGSAAIGYVKLVASRPFYWLQVTALFLLPLCYAIGEHNNNPILMNFILGRKLYQRLFRLVYLTCTTLWYWDALFQGANFDLKVKSFLLSPRPIYSKFFMVPTVVLLYVPIFFLCFWVMLTTVFCVSK